MSNDNNDLQNNENNLENEEIIEIDIPEVSEEELEEFTEEEIKKFDTELFNFKKLIIFLIVAVVSISGIYIFFNQDSQEETTQEEVKEPEEEFEINNPPDIVEALKLGKEIGCTNTHFDSELGRLPCGDKETYLEMIAKYEEKQESKLVQAERDKLTSRLYFVISLFSLFVIIFLLYLNKQSKQHRSLQINGEKYIMPSEWMSLIAELTKITGSNDNVLKRIYSVNTELPENFSQLQQTFLELQKKLNSQDQEIERLKKGYDNHITKKIITRFIRVFVYIEELKEKYPEDSNLDNLRLLMEDALAECNVSEFSPDVGSDYRKLEGVDQNIEIIETTNSTLNYQVAKVLKKGFKISYNEYTDYIQNAIIAVYKFMEEEE